MQTNYFEGRLNKCFETFMAIRENLIGMIDEEFITKTNYRMFIILVKIAMTNLGILRYSETLYFIKRYFKNITLKLKLKFKANPLEKYANKLVKLHLTYA